MSEEILYRGLTALLNSPALDAQVPAADDGPGAERIVAERDAILDVDVPAQQDPQLQRLELSFDGAMVIDSDPLNIGLQNYSDLQNIRYGDRGLEGVQGYTKINSVTALADPNIRSGIQFSKRINGATQSYVLVQAFNAGLTASNVYQNKTAIPNVGDFESTVLHADPASTGLGRFAQAPDGNVVYCNGDETLIWAGEEHRLAAGINFADASSDFRHDVTSRWSTITSDTLNAWTLKKDGSDIKLLIGATRALQGIKFYVSNANAAGASTTAIDYWDGSSFTSVTGLSDGTASGGITFAQTGLISFDSTATLAKAKIEDERMLYFYQVTLSGSLDATIEVNYVTVDAPMQPITDVWNGVYRTLIGGFHEDITAGRTVEFTLDVAQPSFTSAPLGFDARNVDGADFLWLGFADRMSGIYIKLAGENINVKDNVLTLEYWNGESFVAVDNLVDGTFGTTGDSLNKSGLIEWSPPDIDLEFQREFADTQAYWYRLSWSDDMSDTPEPVIDNVFGIPAQRFDKDNLIDGYRFSFLYRNRIMLCANAESDELNRIDYSATSAPDVWNGEDSSDNGKSIRVGDHESLTAAAELTNRFGTGIASTAILAKTNQTWLLVGSTPDDFQTFRISDTIGCPAPLSLVVADVAFSIDQNAVRNIAMWVSGVGPVMFDGGVIVPMRFAQPDGEISSIDAYFDKNDARYVTVGSFENVRGWFDPQFNEYNILLPTAGSTTCNAWLVCDMRRRKWYRKVPSTFPQVGFIVRDANGGQYIYGGVDSGRVVRLENGNTWDGVDIAHLVETSDMLPARSAWDVTLIRYVKVLAVKETGDADSLLVQHAADGSGTFASVGTLALTGSGRYRKTTMQTNLRAWSHQFRYSVTTDDKATAPTLLGVAFMYRIVRQEVV